MSLAYYKFSGIKSIKKGKMVKIGSHDYICIPKFTGMVTYLSIGIPIHTMILLKIFVVYLFQNVFQKICVCAYFITFVEYFIFLA